MSDIFNSMLCCCVVLGCFAMGNRNEMQCAQDEIAFVLQVKALLSTKSH